MIFPAWQARIDCQLRELWTSTTPGSGVPSAYCRSWTCPPMRSSRSRSRRNVLSIGRSFQARHLLELCMVGLVNAVACRLFESLWSVIPCDFGLNITLLLFLYIAFSSLYQPTPEVRQVPESLITYRTSCKAQRSVCR